MDLYYCSCKGEHKKGRKVDKVDMHEPRPGRGSNSGFLSDRPVRSLLNHGDRSTGWVEQRHYLCTKSLMQRPEN